VWLLLPILLYRFSALVRRFSSLVGMWSIILIRAHSQLREIEILVQQKMEALEADGHDNERLREIQKILYSTEVRLPFFVLLFFPFPIISCGIFNGSRSIAFYISRPTYFSSVPGSLGLHRSRSPSFHRVP
jgi:hypothetical protein